MKKVLCVLLALVMALSFEGCAAIKKILSYVPFSQTAAPTESVTDAPTSVPTEAPTEAPTAEPDPTEDPYEAANTAFEELDRELFAMIVSSGVSSYNQYIVSDPGKFGIDTESIEASWGEMSYESHIETMNFYREVLEELAGIDREMLNDMNRLGYDAIKRNFEKELLFEDYYYYDEPLEPLNGYHTMLPLTLLCFNFRTKQDVEWYMGLVEDLPRFMGQLGQFEKEKSEHGLFMTEKALDEVLDSLKDFAKKGESCFLISFFENDVIPKAKELGYTDEECEAFNARNRDAVLNNLLPAYKELASTLESLRGTCSPFVGAAERGEEALNYYKLKVQSEGATNDDIDTIVNYLEQMGETVFYDLRLAISYGSPDIIDRFGEPITFGSVEANEEWLKTFITKYYPECPEYSLKYVNVPEDIADDFSPAAYLTPAFDNYYDNVMLINPTSDSAKDLLTVAHETLPGHMYQFLYARNMQGLSLTQQILEPTGYAEAWTIFTEFFVSKNCTELDSSYCLMMNANSTFCNVYLPAYISFMVNLEGWSISEVADYLSDYGMQEAASIFYEYAVMLPFYITSYAVGYSYLRAIYEKAKPMGMAGHKAFFEKYLSFGPNEMDMMMEYMK
ncbi:MAG: DUF885 family protein [Clostridiales bacterium]|nr:DUF885 family protein [Clostridiales bacterium]